MAINDKQSEPEDGFAQRAVREWGEDDDNNVAAGKKEEEESAGLLRRSPKLSPRRSC